MYFSQTSKETMIDKIKKIVVKKNIKNGTCQQKVDKVKKLLIAQFRFKPDWAFVV
ncbi:hypothetical protein EII25_02070 [Erysipelotrichaceae bacterium OH741_COT-311]|nr:hypothetical protein EII25_02070 [Erysipelotrichaceae bacterium OH741_COT-311]